MPSAHSTASANANYPKRLRHFNGVRPPVGHASNRRPFPGQPIGAVRPADKKSMPCIGRWHRWKSESGGGRGARTRRSEGV